MTNDQLSLHISPRLLYSPENFLIHRGVAEACNEIVANFTADHFRIYFVCGPNRSGKTHFSIKLTALVQEAKLFPRLVEGERLMQWLSQQNDALLAQPDQVVIIDDADHLLSEIAPGQSGPLVNLIEKLRLSRACLILLSAKPLDMFGFDQHIRSRLLPGLGPRIDPPDLQDMPQIINQMARQRGVALSPRKVSYLMKRLGRDIPAVENYLEKLTHLSQVLGKSIKFGLMSDAI